MPALLLDVRGRGRTLILSTSRKFDPKIAFINLSPAQERILQECFAQFRIQSVSISDDAVARLQKQKFEGIVLPIGEDTEGILRSTRNSPINKRLMIFALCKDPRREVAPYSRYGINATLLEPLDRREVHRILKSIHLLILNEFRRYFRIPLVLEVRLEAENRAYEGSSCEVSGGGMSMVIESAKFQVNQECVVSFSLPQSSASRPQSSAVDLRATVCWTKERKNMVGTKFHLEQEGRVVVRKWIDDYLGIK